MLTLAQSGWRIGLVVISELPTGPAAIETLVLRLMGSPAVQRTALAELRGLPAEHPEAQQLLRLVASLRHTFKRATTNTDKDKDDLMTAAWAEFEQYEQRIRREALREGRREDILKICAAFQIPVTLERAERLQQMEDDALSQLIDQLLATRAWP